MTEHEENTILGWDSEIENEGNDFVIFPDDTECECEVIAFDKGAAASGAPMAKLKILCVAEAGRTTVEDNIALQRNCEWKLCEFFTAIGQRRHGQRIVPDWTKVMGARFRARLSKEPWRNNPDRFSNKIKKYLEPVSPSAPEAAEEVSFG